MPELWKPVPGFELRYKISNRGRLCSSNFGLVKLQLDRDGYYIYRLSSHPKEATVKIHRVVMEAFFGPSKLTVNHRNGIKTDNYVANLEYCTDMENRKHARENNLHAHGEAVGGSKLKAREVLEIRRLYAAGYFQQTLAIMFKTKRQNISKIVCRQRWAHI